MNRYRCVTQGGDRLYVRCNNIGTAFVLWRCHVTRRDGLPPNATPPDDLESITLVPEQPHVEEETPDFIFKGRPCKWVNGIPKYADNKN